MKDLLTILGATIFLNCVTTFKYYSKRVVETSEPGIKESIFPDHPIIGLAKTKSCTSYTKNQPHYPLPKKRYGAPRKW